MKLVAVFSRHFRVEFFYWLKNEEEAEEAEKTSLSFRATFASMSIYRLQVFRYKSLSCFLANQILNKGMIIAVTYAT